MRGDSIYSKWTNRLAQNKQNIKSGRARAREQLHIIIYKTFKKKNEQINIKEKRTKIKVNSCQFHRSGEYVSRLLLARGHHRSAIIIIIIWCLCIGKRLKFLIPNLLLWSQYFKCSSRVHSRLMSAK